MGRTRGWALPGCAVALALLVSACGGQKSGGDAAAASAKVLNLFIWADYTAPDTIEKFEKQTGIKVNVAFYDSNEDLETKLLAGSSGYDVVVPSAGVLGRPIKTGV
jgi:putrescine transport system substrate-binding protein